MASPAMADARPGRTALPEALALLAFCGFLLFFGLGAIGLVGADEPRYAQIAREMLARHDWVTPVLNGKPWLEKPALYYWEAMFAYRLFGVSDWAARIPSAFSATTLLAAIYVFCRRLARSSALRLAGEAPAALDAALITLSTAAVIGYGRAASTDMPLAANFTIAMLCWIARYTEADAGATPQHRTVRFHPRLLLFYIFLALATLAKGPVAPALAAIIILAFALVRRDFAIVRDTLRWHGILAYTAITVPWFWLVQVRTGNFFHVFFFEHNLERFGTNLYRHPQPFWYYVPVLLLALAPWTVYGVAALVQTVGGAWDSARRKARSAEVSLGAALAGESANAGAAGQPAQPALADLQTFLVVWALAPLVFFSFSQSKLPGYILPAVPAWTLLLAIRAAGSGRGRLGIRMLHALLSAGLVAAVVVAPYRILRVPVSHSALAVAAVAATLLFVGMLVTLRGKNLAVLRFVTLVPVMIAVAYLLRIVAPAVDLAQSARPVAQELARMESQPARVAVLHVKRETEYGLNFYRNQEISSYDRAEIPSGDHLVVARQGSASELSELAGGRRVVRLGQFPAQGLEFFWVTRTTAHSAEAPR